MSKGIKIPVVKVNREVKLIPYRLVQWREACWMSSLLRAKMSTIVDKGRSVMRFATWDREYKRLTLEQKIVMRHATTQSILWFPVGLIGQMKLFHWRDNARNEELPSDTAECGLRLPAALTGFGREGL